MEGVGGGKRQRVDAATLSSTSHAEVSPFSSRRQATSLTLPSTVNNATLASFGQMEVSTNPSFREETVACCQGAWQDVDTGQTVERDGAELVAGTGDVVKPYCVYVRINGARVNMELDTGAAVSVISEGSKQPSSHPIGRLARLHTGLYRCALQAYPPSTLHVLAGLQVKAGLLT
ncbi:hypothetical protein NHX12_029416 [Muraenolepis orangiensis]|uniref:Uncharacterized protein n=1 Tax=Muraenolepis orangiensis TaxID=630683 RepID=A0A9Q0IPR9_9TELE|nr:hypothetical protein NHX12_029416 [Muraenolepis orangiensis]